MYVIHALVVALCLALASCSTDTVSFQQYQQDLQTAHKNTESCTDLVKAYEDRTTREHALIQKLRRDNKNLTQLLEQQIQLFNTLTKEVKETKR